MIFPWSYPDRVSWRTAISNRACSTTLFVAACALNVYALYAPRVAGTGGFPGMDKVAHVAVFALVMSTAMLARFNVRVLVVILVGHLVMSELVQHYLLPERSGDVGDAVADAVGIALGWVMGRWLVPQEPAPDRGPDDAGPTGNAPVR